MKTAKTAVKPESPVVLVDGKPTHRLVDFEIVEKASVDVLLKTSGGAAAVLLQIDRNNGVAEKAMAKVKDDPNFWLVSWKKDLSIHANRTALPIADTTGETQHARDVKFMARVAKSIPYGTPGRPRVFTLRSKTGKKVVEVRVVAMTDLSAVAEAVKEFGQCEVKNADDEITRWERYALTPTQEQKVAALILAGEKPKQPELPERAAEQIAAKHVTKEFRSFEDFPSEFKRSPFAQRAQFKKGRRVWLPVPTESGMKGGDYNVLVWTLLIDGDGTQTLNEMADVIVAHFKKLKHPDKSYTDKTEALEILNVLTNDDNDITHAGFVPKFAAECSNSKKDTKASEPKAKKVVTAADNEKVTLAKAKALAKSTTKSK